MDRDCHLHIIWGWSNGQWIVRYSSQECGAQANADQYVNYQSNINWAENGIIHQQTNELPHHTWPGYIDSPDSAYYVATYGWSSGMSDWVFETGDVIYPKLYSSSAQRSGELEPPKEDEKESDKMTWVVPVIAGVVGALLTGGAIWYSVKKEEEFGLIGPKGVRVAAESNKGLYIWKVSLQVTSPSRPNLKHQLQYTVQAKNKQEAMEKALVISKRDGNKVIDVVSVIGVGIVHEPVVRMSKKVKIHEPAVRMPKEVKQVVAAMQDNATKAGQLEDSAYAGRSIENGEEVWIVGDNYERIDLNLVYKNGIWYYRYSTSDRPEKPMKAGLKEALANANIFYTG